MLTNQKYRTQKSALTRAKNSGDPLKVAAAVKKAVTEWEGSAWPDGWHTWNIAYFDAVYADQRAGNDRLPYTVTDIRDLIHIDLPTS